MIEWDAPAYPSPKDEGASDFLYRDTCRRAATTAGVAAFFLLVAFALPWYTVGGLVTCARGILCPWNYYYFGPFSDTNWYLYHAPGGSAAAVWSATGLALLLGVVLSGGATFLFGLMSVGRAQKVRLGRYAAICAGGAGATALVAPMLLLGWFSEQGSVWGHNSTATPYTGVVETWGPGLGWYLSIAIAIVLIVTTFLARHDLGDGEILGSDS